MRREESERAGMAEREWRFKERQRGGETMVGSMRSARKVPGTGGVGGKSSCLVGWKGKRGNRQWGMAMRDGGVNWDGE